MGDVVAFKRADVAATASSAPIPWEGPAFSLVEHIFATAKARIAALEREDWDAVTRLGCEVEQLIERLGVMLPPERAQDRPGTTHSGLRVHRLRR